LFSTLVSGGFSITAGGDVIIKAGQDIIAGNKEQHSITAGRDHLEITGNANVNQVTTGDSKNETTRKE
jgi:hypothetical protein